MPRFAQTAFSPAVRARQERAGSRKGYERFDADPRDAALGADETEFVSTRDHFFLASVGETGWPYVQHRGGHEGFVKVLGRRTLAWAERRGNRQYVTLGNLDGDSRVALFTWDQASRTRLKVLGRARVVEPGEDEALWERVVEPGERAERVLVVEVEAFDWNCPQHIVPRFTQEEVAEAVAPLRARIAELEAMLATRERASG